MLGFIQNFFANTVKEAEKIDEIKETTDTEHKIAELEKQLEEL